MKYKNVKISLCSNNWVPGEKNSPRGKYEYEPTNKFKMKVQHNNNNGVPGAAGGSGKLDSSNQPRHTQGREKSRPNNKMLWEQNNENIKNGNK